VIVTLRFENRDAVDDGALVTEMKISRNAVRDVMDWYGAFYAGDDYDVRINGRKQRLGINGELEPDTIDGTVAVKALR